MLPNVASMEFPTLNSPIKHQVEAPHASTMVVHAPIVDNEITHLQSISSINLVLPHNMNTPSTIMDLTMGPRINIAHMVT
jgi:hypothetical protein